MNIWKWFGWNDKDARIEMNRDNNRHSTAQIAMLCVVLAIGLYACSQAM